MNPDAHGYRRGVGSKGKLDHTNPFIIRHQTVTCFGSPVNILKTAIRSHVGPCAQTSSCVPLLSAQSAAGSSGANQEQGSLSEGGAVSKSYPARQGCIKIHTSRSASLNTDRGTGPALQQRSEEKKGGSCT
ncbi:hypothetical protein F2P81_012328 [Scophthalmus maximus]|uniref:Uncharacterized protein n=1 Tax=Scophthalmus maximus TaxID=52904 RepID=A0A6A4SRN7_SCOMX|nr:hypothetical protein F2P81_012328 [Scophthalmus maximus]